MGSTLRLAGRRRFLIAALAACAALLLAVTTSAVAAPSAGDPAPATASATACASGQLHVSGGCVGRRGVRRHIEAMVREAMPELGLRATIIRVDTGEQPLVNTGFGNSMKGVPASPKMYWRIGSIAIPYLIDLLLQLQDEGKLSLNDKLAKYRPNFPEANEVTLRMLANVTSGYPDWVQENEPFQKLLFENPFRQWTANELLHWAFTQPVACPPTTCFHYAHTNFAILSQVISQVTGESVGKLIRERVLAPLGLDHTQISRYPAMPGQALHAYTGERGVYEDDTFWSPSWSIGEGTVMTSTMADVVHGARALGRGELISPRANRERTALTWPGLFPKGLYYALGITLANGWEFQNPFIDGYTGVAAYLKAQDISVGIVTTQLPQSSANGVGNASILLQRLSEYISPAHAIQLPSAL
ncbi:MAG: beta-lactamase family protein [Actinobacteria bacterium]|nr:beta-lactamase family protein [Actinomycetota bacterium]